MRPKTKGIVTWTAVNRNGKIRVYSTILREKIWLSLLYQAADSKPDSQTGADRKRIGFGTLLNIIDTKANIILIYLYFFIDYRSSSIFNIQPTVSGFRF